MIDLEDSHTGQLGHAPRAPVVAGAEDDELHRSGGDGVPHGRVDSRGAEGDHFGHDARHLEAHTALRFSSGVRGLGETPLSLLVEKDARARILEIRDVRQAGIGDGAAKGDEVSGSARTLGPHDLCALDRMTWQAVS